MVTFLITSLLVLGILGLAIYLWQKPAPQSDTELLLPQPVNRALFEATEEAIEQEQQLADKQKRAEILLRAKSGGMTSLNEALAERDSGFYNEVLNAVLQDANDRKLLSVASHISKHNLAVNKTLAEKFQELWRSNPNRQSTAKMLHLSALTDDASTFITGVDLSLDAWAEGRLNDTSGEELHALISGEYWVLSSTVRSSGAGFVLKNTITEARRKLNNNNS
jgi:hypothetical protein